MRPPRTSLNHDRHISAPISRRSGPQIAPAACSVPAASRRRRPQVSPRRLSPLEGDMVAEDLSRRPRLRVAAVAFAVLASSLALAAPGWATPRPAPALTSTDAMLKWINAYRGKPEPDGLPVLVRALSDLQAFKDAESSGAYLGFIARILTIAPADHWVLVRAIAYSGLPHWREILATFVDRMPTRRAMIDKYLDGKLPTLDQITYRPAKPGMLDKIGDALKISGEQKKEVAIEPSPQLIDVLWGFYLATGASTPIERIVKLLPLANDKDSVDTLTTGSAAKFTLASNAVRDLKLLAMLKSSAKTAPK